MTNNEQTQQRLDKIMHQDQFEISCQANQELIDQATPLTIAYGGNVHLQTPILKRLAKDAHGDFVTVKELIDAQIDADSHHNIIDWLDSQHDKIIQNKTPLIIQNPEVLLTPQQILKLSEVLTNLSQFANLFITTQSDELIKAIFNYALDKDTSIKTFGFDAAARQFIYLDDLNNPDYDFKYFDASTDTINDEYLDILNKLDNEDTDEPTDKETDDKL